MPAMNNTCPDTALHRYRRHLLGQGYALNTVRVKVDVVRFVAASSGVEPHELLREHLEEYFTRSLAPWTRRKYIEHLRGYTTWAGIADPTVGLRAPQRPRGVPRPIAEQNLARLLQSAHPRTRAYLMLGAYAGLRSFEIAKVRGSDFEVTAAGPVLRIEGKGGRVDLVPLPASLMREMAPWRAEAGHGRLWPGVTANGVQCAVRRLGQRVDVPVTCHQLRHRYGTALYAVSRDLLLTQQLMRHASPTTTAGYALVINEVGARLVDQLPAPPLATD